LRQAPPDVSGNKNILWEEKMKTYQKLAAGVSTALVGASAFAAGGPTAGDLSGLTPDATTILTAISAITIVVLGVVLAEKALPVIKRMFKF
jgi:hypothetical protein